MAYFPPSWEKQDVDLTKPGNDGTHWGNTETIWPTPLFAADDPRVVATIHEVRERFGGGFHEGTIRWSPERGETIRIDSLLVRVLRAANRRLHLLEIVRAPQSTPAADGVR